MGKWGMDGASGQQTTRQMWKSIDRDSSSSEDSENGLYHLIKLFTYATLFRLKSEPLMIKFYG